jgi:hypothetical protein
MYQPSCIVCSCVHYWSSIRCHNATESERQAKVDMYDELSASLIIVQLRLDPRSLPPTAESADQVSGFDDPL